MLALHPRSIGAFAVIFALALDQAQKWWMLNVFDIEKKQPITVTPFLDVVLSWNHGVSYSLFQGAGAGLLLAGQSIIIVGLLIWLWRTPDRLTAAGLGLVIGGALGNAADRATRGAVADFFYLHTNLPVGPLANYVFNVADVAITLGVALLLFEGLFVAPAPAKDGPPLNRQ